VFKFFESSVAVSGFGAWSVGCWKILVSKQTRMGATVWMQYMRVVIEFNGFFSVSHDWLMSRLILSKRVPLPSAFGSLGSISMFKACDGNQVSSNDQGLIGKGSWHSASAVTNATLAAASGCRCVNLASAKSLTRSLSGLTQVGKSLIHLIKHD
jgi:hypothetical protein